MDLKDLHLHWGESHYKGKTYRSYSLAVAHRQNGKNRKKIIAKLGKLTQEEAQRWRNILEALKKTDAFVTTLPELVVTNHYAYLGVAATNAIWDEWELDTVFQDNGKRMVEVAAIARILTLNRCHDPVAKYRTPEWFEKTALSWMLNINPEHVNSSRIFRDLETIESYKESICFYLYERLWRHSPESMGSVFYDLSSTTFSGSRCVLMKWGHCKEGYHNHVVLALVVNGDGIPFYWEVLPGGTADTTTITWLLDKVKERFQNISINLVFDRGMVSDDNLTLLEDAGIKYISAMDKNQIEGITQLDFTEFSYLEPDKIEPQAEKLSDFIGIKENTYYREVRIEGDRRYILCFNPQLFKEQRQAREQALSHFHDFVRDVNTELNSAKKSRQEEPTAKKFNAQLKKSKLNSFVTVNLQPVDLPGKTKPIRTFQGTVVVNQSDMKYAGRLDGFWLLVTNHNEMRDEQFCISAEKLIPPYQEKVVIEAAFRDIKSFIEIEPVYVWTETHVKAHYTICVLSHVINRILTLKLHENKGNATKDIVSHERFYAELSDCQIDCICVENVQLSTYNMTRPTLKQKELLQRTGLTDLIRNNIVKIANNSPEK